MSDKEAKIGQLLGILREFNSNKIKVDNLCRDASGDEMPFAVVCKKCGSMDVEIIGQRGAYLGARDGYLDGSTSIKCNGCGSAVTVWE